MSFVDLTARNIRLQRCKVVVKNERRFVIGIFISAGSLICGTEITLRIVFWRELGIGLLLLALPGTLCTVRRDDYPLARQRIESAM